MKLTLNHQEVVDCLEKPRDFLFRPRRGRYIVMSNMLQSSFTVLMSCYKNDDPVNFEAALRSIESNTIQPKTVILVVDGPISRSLDDIITQFQTTLPLNVQRLPVNVGLAKALNYGLTFVLTDYCIRADADDVNLQNRFDSILNKLMCGFDLVGSYIAEYDSDSKNYVATKYVPVDHLDILKYASKRNPFNHMSVGFSTNMVREVGCYPNIHLREDYGLWIKLLANGAKTCNIPEVLVHASAGTAMFRRRGGIAHMRAEIDMQSLLVKSGFKGKFRAGFDWFLKSFVYLLPPLLRKYIYLIFLRGN